MSNLIEEIASPLGLLHAESSPEGSLLRLEFLDDVTEAEPTVIAGAGSDLARQLHQYFDKGRSQFQIPLDPQGTDFQKKVWAELCRIPFGQTISYAELATRIGDPAAVRAVARANSQNPIAILIPCHRVIGSDGSLTGYAGGLDRKRALLELEGALNHAQISLFS